MNEQKDENKHQHPQEQLLEAVVVNCQHIAAICKGLCVKGVSYDVSVKELDRHEEVTNSDSKRILKDGCLRCHVLLSDCVTQLNKIKQQYLEEFNKNEDIESKVDLKKNIQNTESTSTKPSDKISKPESIKVLSSEQSLNENESYIFPKIESSASAQ